MYKYIAGKSVWVKLVKNYPFSGFTDVEDVAIYTGKRVGRKPEIY